MILRFISKSLLVFLLISVAFLCMFPAISFAADCRTLNSVERSADPPEGNTQLGGHLTGHIWGLDAPPGWSRKNKTLFTSKEEYVGIWRNYLASKKVRIENCAGADPHLEVEVRTLLGDGKELIGGYSCKDDSCLTKTRIQANKIFFGFIYNNDTKQWILNTAYPTQG